MLGIRIATAAILVTVVVISLFFAPDFVGSAVLGIFLVAAAWEWCELIGRRERLLKFTYVGLLAVAGYVVWRWNEFGGLCYYLFACGVAWWVVAIFLVLQRQLMDSDRYLRWVRNEAVGLLVLLPAWSAIVWLLVNDKSLLLALFVIIWLADAGAYFVGKQWGAQRLAPLISPGKTWEGVAGGLLFGALGAAVFSQLLVFSDEAQAAFIVLALATIAISVVGDLFESMLKRRVGIKDSSQLLPGHGGVLDRIDGLVAAAPVFALGFHQWVSRL